MTIERDGKQYTLTKAELREAWKEKQDEYDYDDVDSAYEFGNDMFPNITDEERKSFLRHCAVLYRKAIDNGAFDWWSCAWDIVYTEMREYEAIKESA